MSSSQHDVYKLLGTEYILLPVVLPPQMSKPAQFTPVYISKSQRAHMHGLSVAMLETPSNGLWVGFAAEDALQNDLQMSTATANVVWLKVAIAGTKLNVSTGKYQHIRADGNRADAL